jgi:hypothetical protein
MLISFKINFKSILINKTNKTESKSPNYNTVIELE